MLHIPAHQVVGSCIANILLHIADADTNDIPQDAVFVHGHGGNTVGASLSCRRNQATTLHAVFIGINPPNWTKF